MSTEIYVTKSTGEREAFDVEKLKSSLERAKASKANIQHITSQIIKQLEDGMSTHEIYDMAFSQLHQLENKAALHYSLRRAVLELGPSGFPFERLVAELLKAQGYETLTDQMVKGRCVEHEVDVVAWRQGREPAGLADSLIMCEAKYHSQIGMKSDLKVILYVRARFEDLGQATYTYGKEQQSLNEGWLVTNTKFTISAIKYAECQGMKIIGWNYPVEDNLHTLIENAKVYPLTCLRTLSDHDKKALLEKNIVLCKTLLEDESLLRSIGLTQANIEAVRNEIGLLDLEK
jgi:hypothetical protein